MSRCFLLIALAIASSLAAQSDDYEPAIPIRPAGPDAEHAIRTFVVPKGFALSLWASEPMLANPVAIALDNKGRLFVCESFRLHKGVTDNRHYRERWLNAELACRTVEDRVAMYRKHLASQLPDLTREHERVRLLEDRDGDGKADRSVVFAGGFKELADGIGAGVLAYRGKVYYTCIPKLWLLSDGDGDGKAEKREALHHGYGVHTALLGHDLHGLRIGPDGLLYFSIGDRGFHVKTRDGSTLAYPDEGAVLRCRLDGSELEVVHRGLRNPQELAFDRHGNLFTGDNNSDGGDKARWVYVVEGGDSGWRIGWQSIGNRGPWNEEKMWHPEHAGQPAFLVPPIANFTNGPSGLTYNPGVGLGKRWDDCFFLCDFRGTSSQSGVWALRARPRGAGFELASTEQFLWKILATDFDFGPDGAMYASDWFHGWQQTGRGRIYRLVDPVAIKSDAARSSARYLSSGLGSHNLTQLDSLLDHPDQRVRQEAQFELVKRRAGKVLDDCARDTQRARLARLHALWGIGQLAREHGYELSAAIDALGDFDEEVRAQAAKVCSWRRHISKAADPSAKLIAALEDRCARVRFFAAQSLGRLRAAGARPALIKLLRVNGDRDKYLRHAAATALARCASENELAAAVGDASRSVRLGVLLALRKHSSPLCTRLLDDEDPFVATEAARAIHDAPIDAAMNELAARLGKSWVTKREASSEALRVNARAFQRRAINANFRLGTRAALDRILAFVKSDADDARRAEALDSLRHWEQPSPRDRVVNLHRPLSKPRCTEVRGELAHVLPELLAQQKGQLRIVACRLAAHFKLSTCVAQLESIVGDASANKDLRRAALQACQTLDTGKLVQLAKSIKPDAAVPLRRLATRILVAKEPHNAIARLEGELGAKDLQTRQNAVELLATLDQAEAKAKLAGLLDRLRKGKLEAGLAFEVLEAAKGRATLAEVRKAYFADRAKDKLGAFEHVLDGGRRGRGSNLFYQHPATSCARCHSVDGSGKLAGPDLKGIGKKRKPRELLRSLLYPSDEIAEGYGSYVLELKDGDVVSGTLQEVDKDTWRVVPEQGETRLVKKKDVEFKSEPNSAMPGVKGILDERQIRDLLAFLRGLK